jgi:DNA-directed RNA polymerase specialized sigma24 family protein
LDPTNTAASFQSTIWSLVLGARGDRAHLEQLLRAYWSPVYAFIRRQGYAGHDASDLTQEFLTQVVIGRDLIGRASPERGRFRSFLKSALRNFLIDQHRMGKAHKGGARAIGPRGTVSMDDANGAARQIAALVPDSEKVFDREWAAAVMEIALARLEESCIADGMELHWRGFNVNVLGPSLRRTSPLSMTRLAEHIGAADETQASNMLQTVKRRFRRVLREVVAETVSDAGQVEEELAELRGHFGG